MSGPRKPGERPSDLRPPTHLAPSPPVPEPSPPEPQRDPDGQLSPTRYGDWEHKGIAVDF